MAEIVKVVWHRSHECASELDGFNDPKLLYAPGTMVRCSCGILYELLQRNAVPYTTNKKYCWISKE